MQASDLKAWRKAMKLKQREAAKLFYVSLRAYQFWEGGERRIPKLAAAHCRLIAQIFNI